MSSLTDRRHGHDSNSHVNHRKTLDAMTLLAHRPEASTYVPCDATAHAAPALFFFFSH